MKNCVAFNEYWIIASINHVCTCHSTPFSSSEILWANTLCYHLDCSSDYKTLIHFCILLKLARTEEENKPARTWIVCVCVLHKCMTKCKTCSAIDVAFSHLRCPLPPVTDIHMWRLLTDHWRCRNKEQWIGNKTENEEVFRDEIVSVISSLKNRLKILLHSFRFIWNVRAACNGFWTLIQKIKITAKFIYMHSRRI